MVVLFTRIFQFSAPEILGMNGESCDLKQSETSRIQILFD
jgi:hypothetical protein